MIPAEAVEAACDYSESCPATEHDRGCYREPLPDSMYEFMGLPNKQSEWPPCAPRVEGSKPHCPDCSGIIGETGIA